MGSLHPSASSNLAISSPPQTEQSNPEKQQPAGMAMAPCAPASVSVSVSARPASFPSSARPRAVGAVRAAGAVEGGRWWAPLLGWSGKADYLEAPAPAPAQVDEGTARRQFVGGLTEEKARQLRARMAQTESFHDAMYHSAIASRLARSA